MTDPIVFLDIDGVLNSQDWYDRRPERGGRLNEPDPDAIARLNRILGATGAKVVISSTWRRLWHIEDIKGWIAARGGRVDGFIGITPFGEQKDGKLWTACQRGREIQLWRETNGHTGPFVVLDDDCDMDDVVDHFVQTRNRWGLTDAEVDEAIGLMADQVPA